MTLDKENVKFFKLSRFGTQFPFKFNKSQLIEIPKVTRWVGMGIRTLSNFESEHIKGFPIGT